MSSGWGISPWGLGGWGGFGAPFRVLGAEAVATRTVRVALSLPPKRVSAIAAGDALNAATWSITRLDTGASYTVLGAEAESDHEILVLLLQPLAGYRINHRVSCLPLISDTGAPVALPGTADFQGLAFDAGAPGSFDRDVANPPLTKPEQLGIGGTLIVVGGDYANERGVELAKKMAYRDLFTPPNAYAHLPGYGFGLGERVKQGLRPGEVPKLAADIGRVLRSRPWINDGRGALSFDEENGILDCRIRLDVKNHDEPVKFPLRLPTA